MMTLDIFQQKCEKLVDSGEYKSSLLSPIGMMNAYNEFKSYCLNSKEYKDMNFDAKRQNILEKDIFYKVIDRFKV